MIYELLSLMPEEEGILKNKLNESDGEILFLVHPFQLELTAPKKIVEKLPFSMVSKMIELFSQDEEISPVIIFDDIRLYDWTREIIERLLIERDRDVYLVPTPPTFPVPGYSDPPIDKRSENRYCKRYEDSYWQRFLVYIGEIGVRSILLGGTSLELYRLSEEDLSDPDMLRYKSYYEQRKRKGANNTNYIPARCVGTAAAWLSTVFDVEITNLTLPHGRNDVLYIEGLEPVSVK